MHLTFQNVGWKLFLVFNKIKNMRKLKISGYTRGSIFDLVLSIIMISGSTFVIISENPFLVKVLSVSILIAGIASLINDVYPKVESSP